MLMLMPTCCQTAAAAVVAAAVEFHTHQPFVCHQIMYVPVHFSRERIKLLLDPGSPFLELSQLAGRGLYGEQHKFATLASWGCTLACLPLLVTRNQWLYTTCRGGRRAVRRHRHRNWVRARPPGGDRGQRCYWWVPFVSPSVSSGYQAPKHVRSCKMWLRARPPGGHCSE